MHVLVSAVLGSLIFLYIVSNFLLNPKCSIVLYDASDVLFLLASFPSLGHSQVSTKLCRHKDLCERFSFCLHFKVSITFIFFIVSCIMFVTFTLFLPCACILVFPMAVSIRSVCKSIPHFVDL